MKYMLIMSGRAAPDFFLSCHLRDVNPSKVIGAKSGVAFGTFPLPGFVSRFKTRKAKDVEAFGKDGVFPLDFARRTSHLFFVFLQFLRQHFVRGCGHLELLHPLHLLSVEQEGWKRETSMLFQVDSLRTAQRYQQINDGNDITNDLNIILRGCYS